MTTTACRGRLFDGIPARVEQVLGSVALPLTDADEGAVMISRVGNP